jgi:Thiolase, N-terminal domain
MPETAENVAEQYQVNREDQVAFALRSHQRWARAYDAKFFEGHVVSVEIPQKKGEPKIVTMDEHPRRDTTLEALARLRTVVKANGTVTAGNASGINDGAGAVLLASARAISQASPYAPGSSGCGRSGRSRAEDHGHYSGSGNAESVGKDRPETFTNRCHRMERGLCGASARGDSRIGFTR